MNFKVKNEEGDILDFKGENIVFTIHLRQV